MINYAFSSIKVSISKDFSPKKCGTIPSGGWEVKDSFERDIVVTFRSDGKSNRKGFQAVYTFALLEGCK